MQEKTLYCPNCGKPYKADDTKEFVFCAQCGQKNPGSTIYRTEHKSGKIRTAKCPSCGADVSFKNGNDTAVCEYCGTTLMEDRTIIINKYIDETKVKEVEAQERMRAKEIEHEKEMAEYREKQEEKNRRHAKTLLKLFLWLAGGFGYAAFIAWSIDKHNGGDFTAMILLINVAVYSLIAAIGSYIYFSNKKDLSYYMRNTTGQAYNNTPNQNNASPARPQKSNDGEEDDGISAGKVIGGIAAAGIVAGLLRRLFK